MDNYLEYSKVFKALSDPKRAMIVDMLSVTGKLKGASLGK